MSNGMERRGFIRGAGLVAGVAATATLIDSPAMAQTLPKQSSEPMSYEIKPMPFDSQAIKGMKVVGRRAVGVSATLIAATAITALVPAPERCRAGRDFAAWLGLTMLQRSTGAKQKLGAISRMGERTIRRLLILGASAVVRWSDQRSTPADSWLAGMLARKPNVPRVRDPDMDPVRELPCRPAAVRRRIRGRTDGSIQPRATTVLTFPVARKGVSTDVASSRHARLPCLARWLRPSRRSVTAIYS